MITRIYRHEASTRTDRVTDRRFPRPPPRRARINPPLPVDEFGNWYESEEERAKKKRDENSDNLTAAERAILADLD